MADEHPLWTIRLQNFGPSAPAVHRIPQLGVKSSRSFWVFGVKIPWKTRWARFFNPEIREKHEWDERDYWDEWWVWVLFAIESRMGRQSVVCD